MGGGGWAAPAVSSAVRVGQDRLCSQSVSIPFPSYSILFYNHIIDNHVIDDILHSVGVVGVTNSLSSRSVHAVCSLLSFMGFLV